MPPEERESFQKQIDGELARNRPVCTPERLEYHPRRKGFALVLIVNVAVVVLVAGSIFGASALLDKQEASIAREPERILTTESKVIAALKEESEQQLKRKDQDIIVSDRLQKADAERQRLGAESQAAAPEPGERPARRVRGGAPEAAREVEKGGFSEAEIAARLRRLEAANASELEKRLAEAREAARKERDAQEATIAAVGAASTSRSSREPRPSVPGSTGSSQQRVAELEKQLAQRAGEAERASSAFAEELRRLEQQHESERLVLEQLVSAYERSSRLIESQATIRPSRA